MRTEKIIVFDEDTFRDAIVECPVDENGVIPADKVNACKVVYKGRPKTLRNGIMIDNWPHEHDGPVWFDQIEFKDGTKMLYR